MQTTSGRSSYTESISRSASEGALCVSQKFDLAGTEHSTILQPASVRHLASVELGGSPTPGAYQEMASLLVRWPARFASRSNPSVPLTGIPFEMARRRARASSRSAMLPGISRASISTWDSPGPRSVIKDAALALIGACTRTHLRFPGCGRSNPFAVPASNSTKTAGGTIIDPTRAGMILS